MNAQVYRDHFIAPDSAGKKQLQKQVVLFKLMNRQNVDSLYAALGKNENVIRKDTLVKYHSIYKDAFYAKEEFAYHSAGSSFSPDTFLIERTFIHFRQAVMSTYERRSGYTSLCMQIMFTLKQGNLVPAKVVFHDKKVPGGEINKPKYDFDDLKMKTPTPKPPVWRPEIKPPPLPTSDPRNFPQPPKMPSQQYPRRP